MKKISFELDMAVLACNSNTYEVRQEVVNSSLA